MYFKLAYKNILFYHMCLGLVTLWFDALDKNGQGLAFNSYQWWDSPPSFVSPLLHKDCLSPSA